MTDQSASPHSDGPVAWLHRSWPSLLVGAGLVFFLLGIRTYSRASLSGEVTRLDLGLTFHALIGVVEGRAIYSEVPCVYGPYWVAYYAGALHLFGDSIGGVRWAIAGLMWLYAFGVYVLAACLGRRSWAAVALVASLATPTLTLGVPYSGTMVAPLLIALAGAVVWACTAGAASRRWFVVGGICGALLSVRWLTALIAIAAVGLVWAATGRLRLPGRHGHVLGTALVPGVLILCVALALGPYPLSMWVTLGAPVVAAAAFAARASWEGRGMAALTWTMWARTPVWSALGALVGMAPWVIVLGVDRGIVRAMRDVYLSAFTWYRTGGYLGDTFQQLGVGAPPWPRLAIALVLCGLAIAWWGNARLSPGRARGLNSVLLAAGGAIVLLDAALSGSGRFLTSLAEYRLWLLSMGFTAWASFHAWRGNLHHAPGWVIPLGCYAGVLFLAGFPGDAWHIPGIEGSLLVLAAGLAARWTAVEGQSTPHARSFVPAFLALLLALGLEVSTLWYAWPARTWRPLRKPLVWLDLPRAQVWDLESSARLLRAHVAFIQERVPRAAPVFAFPDPLLPLLSGHTPAGPVAYFLPEFSQPTVDAYTAALLRVERPPLAVVRMDESAWFGHPDRLAEAYPELLKALEMHYRGVRRIDTVYYYEPAPSDSVDVGG